MSDALAWSLVPLFMVPAIVILLVREADREFWLNLEDRHPTLADFLWGFVLHPIDRFPDREDETE